MTVRLWVLGAADPEMAAIEQLLTECGESFAYAVGPDGKRVHPGNAYRAVGAVTPAGEFRDGFTDTQLVYVECAVAIRTDHNPAPIVIDHHRPGDPGYGKPPAEFLAASSIGQVLDELVRLDILVPHYDPAGWHVSGEARSTGISWVDAAMTAAADHCLAAAYRGECPGVHPDDLMRWRAESRAKFQGRAVSDVLADVEYAREALRRAEPICLTARPDCTRCNGSGRYYDAHGDDSASGQPSEDAVCACGGFDPQWAADLRGQHVPELPEAAAREGVCFVADGLPGPDGRVKVVCQSGSPEQIEAFMRVWAPAHGLTDIYGDPARGFAGGYLF